MQRHLDGSCAPSGSLIYLASLQCLIKKDREDQNDPTIGEFYEKLATAYEDPALGPSRYSRGTETNTSPLLHDIESR